MIGFFFNLKIKKNKSYSKCLVFCVWAPLISTESRVKGLQREFPSLPDSLNTGNCVCLGIPKQSWRKEPPASQRSSGEIVWAHTSPYTHCIAKKNAFSSFKVQAWKLLEKSEIWHTQPGNGSHLGVLIFWGQGPGWLAEWSWGSAGRGEGGKGQMGACQVPENCPKHLRGLGFWAEPLRGCPSCFCFIYN